MRCFYASDIHGSELCWRKFLNAGAYYGVDVLILGGDVIGKAIVPITMDERASGRATFHGRSYVLESEDALAAFEKQLRGAGFYPMRATQAEIEHLTTSDAARELAFESVVKTELRRWISIAEEKIDRRHLAVFVMPGNDDPWFIDGQLQEASCLTMCDEAVLGLAGCELLSLSYSNPTPWDSPRELSEDELYTKIASLASTLEDPETAIFNLHVPPYGSGLDTAPRLDETLTPVLLSGQVEMVPVGSHAVRRAIENFQPLVSVHGHIHESRCMRKLGRTLAINPGSEYASGRIHGSLFEIRNGKLRGEQFVSG